MTSMEPGFAQPGFPTTRLRRLRYQPAVRGSSGRRGCRRPTGAAAVRPPGQECPQGDRRPCRATTSFRPTCSSRKSARLADLGLGGVILFGIPAKKTPPAATPPATRASSPRPSAPRSGRLPELLVITDVCFCEYTDHGHCGPISEATGRTDVDNDATLELLARQAVVHARAGADMVAPSGMMDGMVGAIRRGLDAAGFAHVPIMSYAAKYASAFYGPFREAAESAPQFGDRRGYQMDPAAAAGQAMREVELDLAEGADIDHGQAGFALPRHHPPGRRPLSRRAAGGV